jgi:hypothetical protein
VLRWASDDLLHLRREEIGEYYGRYRLCSDSSRNPSCSVSAVNSDGLPDANGPAGRIAPK